MAEREGFEPSVPILSEHTISNRAPSTARASLRINSNRSQATQHYRSSIERGMCSVPVGPPPPFSSEPLVVQSFRSPNPRSRFCRNTRFPIVPLQPLGHLSAFCYVRSHEFVVRKKSTTNFCVVWSPNSLLRTPNLLFFSSLLPEKAFQDVGALNFENPFLNLHSMVEFIA